MNKILFTGILAIVLVATLVSAQQTYSCPMYGFGSGTGYGFAFGWIFQILIIVAIVLFIVWLVKQLQAPKGRK